MKKAREYVQEASYQLNDQAQGRAYTRWTRAQLLTYLNGALSEIAGLRPEEFVAQTDVVLAAGRRQLLANPEQRIVSVNSNADGSVVGESDLDLLRAYAPYDCCAVVPVFNALGNPIYKARTYAIDPKEPKAFYVSPPVPTGLTPTVKATVFTPPTKYTLTNINDDVLVHNKYEQSILDYMLGRAFQIDLESPQGRANANTHLSNFYNLFGMKYKFEAAYRAGNYNGSIGDGDPRAHV